MFMTGLILIGVLLCVRFIPSLFRRRRYWDLTAFCVLLLLGVGVNAAHALNVRIPSPLLILQAIFGPVSDVILGF